MPNLGMSLRKRFGIQCFCALIKLHRSPWNIYTYDMKPSFDDILRDLSRRSFLGEETSEPTVERIAAMYGISRAQAGRAHRILCRKGVFRKKAARQSRSSRPRRGAARKMADVIRERIAQGVYHAGMPLPKRDSFVREQHVSSHTVRDALAMLSAEKLIYRAGRRWMVGRPQPRRVHTPLSTLPVIVVVQPTAQHWPGLFNQRTKDFPEAFLAEARRYGVQAAFVSVHRSSFPLPTMPSGRLAIGDFIRRLGFRYRGALVVSGPRLIPHLGDWLDLVGRHERPVVWLDCYGEDLPAEVRSGRHFTRAYFDEPGGVRIALKALAGQGHRVLAYPSSDRSGWMVARRRLLRQHIEEQGMALKLYACEDARSVWSILAEGGFGRVARIELPMLRTALAWLRANVVDFEEETLRFASSHRHPALVDYVKFLGRRLAKARMAAHGPDELHRHALAFVYTSLFAPYVAPGDATALVAPNDANAAHLYFWLHMAGYRIPSDFSILSFDNYYSFSMQPISTVDFGFGHLGYQAFHAIMEDIPVDRDSTGDIPSRPQIAHRGSIARPAGRG